MNTTALEKIFEHNHWANLQIIDACAALNDEQLDAEPQSITKGSIRLTLLHIVGSQQWYLSMLTLPVEERSSTRPAYEELRESATSSGEGFIALAREASSDFWQGSLETADGYVAERWVVMLQAINHATEHREQIKSMLTALGVTPPGMSGWDYGEAIQALVPKST